MTTKGSVYIYGLADPITEVIFYVGKSVEPRRRHRAHIANARTGVRGAKYDWIRGLGAEPNLVILDKVSKVSWQFHERFWIDRWRDLNPLLTNVTPGGEGIDSETASRINEGRRLPEESRLKIGASLREHYQTPGSSAHCGHYRRTKSIVKAMRNRKDAKLTQADVHEIRKRLAAGEYQSVIAESYGISQSMVSKIVNGKAWVVDT